MQGQITRLAAFARHLEMRDAFADVPEVLDLELAQFLAAQRVKQQGGENGSVALAADLAVLWRIEQLARLMIGNRRRLAFAAFRFRPLDAFHRIMGDGVLIAEIFIQGCQRREPVPDCAAAEATLRELVAPGDDMRARDDPKFLRSADSGKAHEVLDGRFVRAARARIREIAEPLDLRRHVGEFLKLGGRQQAGNAGGGDFGRKLVAGHCLMPPCFRPPYYS